MIDNFNNIMRTMLLAQSVFKTSRIIPKDALSDDNAVNYSKIDITNEMAKHILKHFDSAIKENKTEYGKQISIQLLVIKIDDFKELIEAGIQTLPKEIIDRIRNGENILQDSKKL